ncbi:11476_t:CDS:1, partial [Funneliformis mosseae]
AVWSSRVSKCRPLVSSQKRNDGELFDEELNKISVPRSKVTLKDNNDIV